MTGGVHRAAAGEITIIVGGDDAVYAAHRELLGAIGGEVIHVGPLGKASVIKVITNDASYSIALTPSTGAFTGKSCMNSMTVWSLP